MATVTITINAREYAISCEDGQEGRILQLSRLLDEKAKLLTDGTSQISENMLLAMVALILADELSELKKGKMPEQPSAVDLSKYTQLDKEMAQTIKNLDQKIKTLANEINLL